MSAGEKRFAGIASGVGYAAINSCIRVGCQKVLNIR